MLKCNASEGIQSVGRDSVEQEDQQLYDKLLKGRSSITGNVPAATDQHHHQHCGNKCSRERSWPLYCSQLATHNPAAGICDVSHSSHRHLSDTMFDDVVNGLQLFMYPTLTENCSSEYDRPVNGNVRFEILPDVVVPSIETNHQIGRPSYHHTTFYGDQMRLDSANVNATNFQSTTTKIQSTTSLLNSLTSCSDHNTNSTHSFPFRDKFAEINQLNSYNIADSSIHDDFTCLRDKHSSYYIEQDNCRRIHTNPYYCFDNGTTSRYTRNEPFLDRYYDRTISDTFMEIINRQVVEDLSFMSGGVLSVELLTTSFCKGLGSLVPSVPWFEPSSQMHHSLMSEQQTGIADMQLSHSSAGDDHHYDTSAGDDHHYAYLRSNDDTNISRGLRLCDEERSPLSNESIWEASNSPSDFMSHSDTVPCGGVSGNITPSCIQSHGLSTITVGSSEQKCNYSYDTLFSKSCSGKTISTSGVSPRKCVVFGENESCYYYDLPGNVDQFDTSSDCEMEVKITHTHPKLNENVESLESIEDERYRSNSSIETIKSPGDILQPKILLKVPLQFAHLFNSEEVETSRRLDANESNFNLYSNNRRRKISVCAFSDESFEPYKLSCKDVSAAIPHRDNHEKSSESTHRDATYHHSSSRKSRRDNSLLKSTSNNNVYHSPCTNVEHKEHNYELPSLRKRRSDQESRYRSTCEGDRSPCSCLTHSSHHRDAQRKVIHDTNEVSCQRVKIELSRDNSVGGNASPGRTVVSEDASEGCYGTSSEGCYGSSKDDYRDERRTTPAPNTTEHLPYCCTVANMQLILSLQSSLRGDQ